MRLSIQEAAAVCKGQILGKSAVAGETRPITGVSIDSRKITPGSLFVPFAGTNVDGHDYIPAAAAKGAVCALTERACDGAGMPLIKVDSTYTALADLAAYYRGLFDVAVVAVTGSAGKTTTKDLIASVLAGRFRTCKTQGNLNNAIGLPLTVFGIDADTEALVLEMGMNHFGEIAALSRIAKPDIAVITNIGDAHMENLGSRDGILQAKLEITAGLAQNGVMVINGEDPLLTGAADTGALAAGDTGALAAGDTGALVAGDTGALAAEPVLGRRIVVCGGARPSAGFGYVYAEAVQMRGLDGMDCVITFEPNGMPGDWGEAMRLWRTTAHIPLPGKHMVTNALMAMAVGAVLGLSPETAAEGLARFVPSAGRMATVYGHGMTIINDTYNANPAAMRAAIDVLTGLPGRKVCVLGDMLQLGEQSEAMHRAVGAYAAAAGVALLVGVGDAARAIVDGYNDQRNDAEHVEQAEQAVYFTDKEAFLAKWRKYLREGDAVLVKASRGMAFEGIVEALAWNTR